MIFLALLAAVLWLPHSWSPAILIVICALAQWEFYALLAAARIPHFKFVGLLGGAALILTTWCSLQGAPARLGDGEAIVLVLLTAAVFLRQFPQKNNPQPLETVAGTLLGVLYVPFLFNFFTRLLATWGDHTGRLLILYLVLVVKSTDVGAYFVGCSIGRHKLIPRISPAKTWEGCVGGAAAGVLASVLFYVFGHGKIGILTVTWTDACVMGLFLAVAGTVGDLTESLFKRAAGVKDSSRLIAGMGGLLDVLDSLLFTAPALYACARWFLG